MIPIPEKGKCIKYYVPTVMYHTDDIPNDNLEDYMHAAIIGRVFDNDDSDVFRKEAEIIFGKIINTIKSGELKADYIEGFNPDNIRPDWDEHEIYYYTGSSTEYFMYMHTDIIRISNINGHISIYSPTDFVANLYKNKWYFTYVNGCFNEQRIFPILMDIDAEAASINDIVKIMLDTLPKQHPDIDEFF